MNLYIKRNDEIVKEVEVTEVKDITSGMIEISLVKEDVEV